MPPLPFDSCPMYPQWNIHERNRNIDGNAPMSQYASDNPSAQHAASDATHVYVNPNANTGGQMLQYTSQYIDAPTWNQDHGPSAQQYYNVAPQGVPPQDHIYSSVGSGEATAYNGGYQGVQEEFRISVSHDNNNARVPLSEYGSQFGIMSPERSATSQVIRRVATVAVIDASERRRVNPHRFFCSLCGRGFTATHNYKRHLRAHYGQRPFPCYCGSAFTTSSDLKRHHSKSKKHDKRH